MLTLHQLDRIVHNTLLTMEGFEIERGEAGSSIFYDVYDTHATEKVPLGTYRVWEWHDGSSRCGWMPLDTNDSFVVRIRNMIWEAIMAVVVPANASTESDTSQHMEEPPPSSEAGHKT